MKLLGPIQIIRHGDLIAAVAVVVDRLNVSVFRETGEDNATDTVEASRIVNKLIDVLVFQIEVDVTPSERLDAQIRACKPYGWVQT